MPPRYAYWTILIDGTPTAFRAHDQEELLPTLKQLQHANPNAEMKWFSKGRLWSSPADARAAQGSAPGPKRPGDWRPGGEHADPRARFKKKSSERKPWKHAPRGAEGAPPPGTPPSRPEGGAPGGRPPFRPEGGAPGGRPPFRPQGGAPGGERAGGRPPFRPQGSAPGGRPPFRPQGSAPGGRPPRPAWKPKPKGAWSGRPAGGGGERRFEPRGEGGGERAGGRPPFRPQGGAPGGERGGKPPFRPQGGAPGGRPPRKPFRPKGAGPHRPSGSGWRGKKK